MAHWQPSSPRAQMIWLPRPLILATLLLITVISVGIVGYVLIEGWTAWDAFWMIVITLTSIGYGEVHPLSHAGRAWTILLIVSGLSVGTYTLSRLTTALVEGDLLNDFRSRRRNYRMQRMKNHFIVVGAGRLGRSVLEEIRSTGREICVIEKNPEAARLCEIEENVVVLVGDGANDAILRRAGIDHAAGMAVAVPSGAEAIFVTLSARHLAPDLPIATRASDEMEATKARRAGATSVVSPFRMGGWRMAHGLIRPEASNFLDLATFSAYDELLLDELVLHADSVASGRTLRDLNIRTRYQVLIVAVRRSSGEMLPAPEADTKLNAGDIIIVIGAPAGVRRFERDLF